VFLSYASQDARAAQKTAEVLRAGGIEVFLDQSELRGGDAWDKKIRHEIHNCVLFIPIISQHTQERLEGYFRHEWNLAIERTHHMAAQKAFLVPVVVDGTGDQEAFVPDEFRAVQWTRLPAGETPPEFVRRIQQLLSGEARPLLAAAGRPAPVASGRPSRLKLAWIAAMVVIASVAAYVIVERPWTARSLPAAAFSPPAHSIAVLPFVNMSGDKDQEYFSDGLTEEILNSLARVSELQVSARTSSFSFKGKDVDLVTIAHKLNVGSVLEGSVRRAGSTIRITAQLNNAVTGFHLWSQTYDRNLSDVLKLQTEIADAVASALKVSLLGDVATKIELGGTRNPLAFDAYLRGLRSTRLSTNEQEARLTLDAYAEAVRLDPDFALAYAARALALSDFNGQWGTLAMHTQNNEKARIDAERAIALAPGLGLAHAALARILQRSALDYPRASEESERALALAPGNAIVLSEYSQQATYMGRFNAAIDTAKRGVALDPLNLLSHRTLGDALYFARRYNEAIAAYQDAIAVDPGPPESYARRGLAYYALGSAQMAGSSCEMKPDYWESRFCLALTFEKLGQRRESDLQIKWLTEFYGGDPLAYQFAEIYAQRGDRDRALEWLDTALRLRDAGFRRLKTDPLMDPLRSEPRFQAIMRELRFPD
jgi:TolB-like protein